MIIEHIYLWFGPAFYLLVMGGIIGFSIWKRLSLGKDGFREWLNSPGLPMERVVITDTGIYGPKGEVYETWRKK